MATLCSISKIYLIYLPCFLFFNQEDSVRVKNDTNTKIKSKAASNKRPKSNTDDHEEPTAKRIKRVAKPVLNKIDTDLNEINFDCSKLNVIGNKYNLKISSWNVSGIRAVIKV